MGLHEPKINELKSELKKLLGAKKIRHFSLNATTHAGVPKFVITQRLSYLSLRR